MLAAASMAASVSAQTVTESKTLDNWYIGINGGVATKTTQNNWTSNLNPNAGLRIGRYFTPVFGLAVESSAYFSNKPYKGTCTSDGYFTANGFDKSTGTIVRGINTSLLATINLSNWFGGYKGEPRSFEVIPVFGFGWAHSFTSNTKKTVDGNKAYQLDALTSKAGIDFAYNFGGAKQVQV